ncbi:hypothetical protein Agub_g11756 [Astrephomene gubernaculifera]|uniref:Pseudouridine synthase RsuA/RluA-like domain-containing protein n=1 Tax=Astrephomene gubernaculifera TaxID=47775 RepID=A0AAD3E1T7_9CHLO|nr:hypothetical protein Agub_g11756 [Astrephomene gubernaculifera]
MRVGLLCVGPIQPSHGTFQQAKPPPPCPRIQFSCKIRHVKKASQDAFNQSVCGRNGSRAIARIAIVTAAAHSLPSSAAEPATGLTANIDRTNPSNPHPAKDTLAATSSLTSSNAKASAATTTTTAAATSNAPPPPSPPSSTSSSASSSTISSASRARLSQEEISARIAASHARRATRLSYNCPACSISAATPPNIARHMSRCCPDLMESDLAGWGQLDSLPRGYPSPQHDLAVALLRAAAAREHQLRHTALHIVFWSGPLDPATGLPVRLGEGEAAARLGLPPARVSSLLRAARVSVPLASDWAAFQAAGAAADTASAGAAASAAADTGAASACGSGLDVLWEDEYFLAVNKPPGVNTAPVHRFVGGSMVNRVIAYLNRDRRAGSGQQQQQQVTLLNHHTAATAGPAAAATVFQGMPLGAAVPFGYLPPLLPPREPFALAGAAAAASSSSATSSSATSSSAATSSDGEDLTDDTQHPPHHQQQQQSPQPTHGSSQRQLEPYVLHRLDMHTSGLLLFAKRSEVVAAVHRQFRERSLSKLYLAAAVGCPPPSQDRFSLHASIDRHPSQPVARMVADTGKDAATSFTVLARNPHISLLPGQHPHPHPHLQPHPHPHLQQSGADDSGNSAAAAAAGTAAAASVAAPGLLMRMAAAEREQQQQQQQQQECSDHHASSLPASNHQHHEGASLILCAPHTGRTHQIRVHLAHVRHPIVGDDVYGISGPWINRQALHAAALQFLHPMTGRVVRLTAPLPYDMRSCLVSLGLPVPDVEALAEQEWRRLEQQQQQG